VGRERERNPLFRFRLLLMEYSMVKVTAAELITGIKKAN